MFELMPYLMCLDQIFSKSTLSQLTMICESMLCCEGRVTMLGLSRWSEEPSSNYRRIQRFYSKSINWLVANWLIFQNHRHDEQEVYILAGDETTVSKAGKKTFGLGKFFSSVNSRHIKGLGFFSLCLVGVSSRSASPLLMEQLPAELNRKTKPPTEKKPRKLGKGRPKGSKNKSNQKVQLTEYLKWIQSQLKATLLLIQDKLPVTYFVYDGAFGNNESLQKEVTRKHFIDGLYVLAIHSLYG